jgi:hypothetical protein
LYTGSSSAERFDPGDIDRFPCPCQVPPALQVHPVLGRSLKKCGETHGGVSRQRCFPSDQTLDPRTRDAQLFSERRSLHAKGQKVKLEENFAWMGWFCKQTHGCLLSVVIHYFDVSRPLAGPDETNAPLSIDANRMLARTVAAQRFQMIAWREAEVVDRMRRIQRGQHGTRAFDQIGGKPLPEATRHGVLGELSANTDNHKMKCIML